MMHMFSSFRAWLLLAVVPLVALAVLFVASGSPSAEAQDTVTLVSNAGTTTVTGASADHHSQTQSQAFTTGSNELGYTLSSIEVSSVDNPSQAESGTVKAELWSNKSGNVPNAKIASLTVPTDIGSGTVSFAAPANTALTKETTYHLVTYTVGSYGFSLHETASNDQDDGASAGWSIADVRKWASADNPNTAASLSWGAANPANVIKISVKGAKVEPPTIVLSSSATDNKVTEGNTDKTVTITATLKYGEAPTSDLTVALARESESTATVTSDYTLATSITITAGETSGQTTLTIKGDALVEGDEKGEEKLVLSATATNWASGSLTVTITDDDAAAARIAFGNSATGTSVLRHTVSEAVGHGTRSVTVRVSHLPQADTAFTINVLATGANPATKGTDYTVPASVTFGPSTPKSKTITISITNDALVEYDETVSLQIAPARPSSDQNFDLGDHYTRHANGSKAVVTITDDERARSSRNTSVAFGSSVTSTTEWTASVDEDVSGGTLSVPVTVRSLPGADTTFNVDVITGNTGGTATQCNPSATPAVAGDYCITTKSVTFRPTDTDKTENLSITIENDALVEVNQTIKLRIRAADTTPNDLGDYYQRHASSSTATVTINDDDAGGAKAAFGSSASSTTKYGIAIGENAAAWNIPIRLSHLPEDSTTFTVRVLNTGTATENTDYTLSAKTFTFSSSSALFQNLTVTPRNDALVEDAEDLELEIASGTGLFSSYTLDANGSKARVEFADDDSVLAKIAFGNDAQSTDVYTASVDEDVSGRTLSVPITVSHLPGSATTFNVDVITGNTGGTATQCNPSATPAVAGDYCITTKSVSFSSTGAKKKNLAITIENDALVEVNQTIKLRIRAADNPGNDLGDHYARHASSSTATLTIKDDEARKKPKAAFGNSASSTTKLLREPKENSGTVTIPVTITAKPEESTTFTVRVLTTGTATENTDYTIAPTTLTFTSASPLAQNVVVTLTNDELVERDQTVELELVKGTGLASLYSLNAQAKLATVTIDDDDAEAAKIAFHGSDGGSTEVYTVTVDETVQTSILTVPVTVNRLPEQRTVFEVEVVASGTTALDTADSGNPTGNPRDYYVIGSQSVTFEPAAPKTASLNIHIEDDDVEEDNETIALRIAAARSASHMDFDLGDYYARHAQGATAKVTLTSEDEVDRVTLTVDRTARADGAFGVAEGTDLTVTATANIPVGPNGWQIEAENTELARFTTVLTACQSSAGQFNGWACPNDYRLPAAFTIQEGQTTATGTLRLLSDSRPESNEERLSLRATATRGSRSLTTNTLDLRVADNNAGISVDPPALGLVTDETVKYSLKLRGEQPTHNVVITPTSGDTDAATVSCAVDPCTLTFTPQNWETAQEITVTAVAVGSATISHAAASDDTDYNGLTSLASVAVTVEAPVQQYTITAGPPAAEGESAELTVTLGAVAPTGGLAFTVDRTRTNDVKYLTASPPAQTPEDGLADTSADLDSPPTTVTVAEGKRTATLTDPLAADDLVEGDEHYYVVISTTTAGWSAAPRTHPSTQQSCAQDASCARVTITDADAAEIAFGNSATATAIYTNSVSEAGATLSVPVTVSALPKVSTTFNVEVLGTGTATEDTDYTIATKSVTFGPTDTDTTQNVAVAITEDTGAEGDETIRLRIAPADNPANDLGDRYQRHPNGSQATLTITDNDGAVEVSATSVSVKPGQMATYTVQLAGARPSSDVRVTPTSGSDAIATVSCAANPCVLTFNSGNWNQPQTVTVTGVAEDDTAITHAVDSTDAAYPSTLTASVGVTVTALPTASLSVSPNPVREGSSITLTVTLSEAISTQQDIPILLTKVTAEDGDYDTLGSIAIKPGRTRHTDVIRTRHDPDTADERFTVALTNLPASLAAGSPIEVTVTIQDDDTPSRRGVVGGVVGGGRIPTVPIETGDDDTGDDDTGDDDTEDGDTEDGDTEDGDTEDEQAPPAPPTLADIQIRDRLIADQEALLNVYRCMFDIDTQIVPGGCADGRPTQDPAPPGAFEGTPTQEDIEVRDRLVADQEALLNVYRCMFDIDTQIVPGGCVDGRPAPPPAEPNPTT